MATQTEQRELVTAWIDPRDRQRLVELARTHDRSLSAELRRAIRRHVARNDAEEERER
jgi:predicted transcriptional regulator